MSRSLRYGLYLVALLCLLPVLAAAGTDEYQGDTYIYSGLPTKTSPPNILFLIDNSRATLEPAPGDAYKPEQPYPPVANCGTKGYPRCYEENTVYSIDNQGDVANGSVLEDYTVLETTCDLNSSVIYATLKGRGTYSGAGSNEFPNIGANGVCDLSPKGAVYVLGKYLNYTLTTTGPTPEAPPGVPAACNAATVPIVKLVTTEQKCSVASVTDMTKCKPPKTITTTIWEDFYQLTTTNSNNQPPNVSYWTGLGKFTASENKYPGTLAWSAATTYTMPDDLVVDGKSCKEWKDAAGVVVPPAAKQLTQREIFYKALEQVVGSALGVAKYGAMVYDPSNSGGKLVYGITDLSKDVDLEKLLPGEAPDCTKVENSELPFCKFLAALPGPRKDPDAVGPFSQCTDFTGADCVSSNTARPQAEGLFDAGYYFGANYTPISNNTVMPRSADDCRFDYVILLTNGFTNGDGSPKLAVVGDADKDGYPDETVYGLGSHWLDDVAYHLSDQYGISTHAVLAFQAKDQLVENAATVDGGGTFYQAFSFEELVGVLGRVLAGIINEASTSFVAPVVPASTTNRTISSNKVYLGLFRPQGKAPWHGNVKKYSIAGTDKLLGFDAAGNVKDATNASGTFDQDSISYWSLKPGEDTIPSAGTDIDPNVNDINKAKGDGGQVDAGGTGGRLLRRVETLAAAIQAQDNWQPSGASWRKIYTVLEPESSLVASANLNLTADQNLLVPWNANIKPETLGVSTEAEKDDLIRYLHGFVSNSLALTSKAAARNWVLGDILHSRPLVFNYSKYSEAEESLCAPAEAGGRYNSSVIYVGANDGMLHAFRDCDGEELWGFIPPDALPSIKYFPKSKSAGGHPTYVDGAPSAFVHDLNANGIIDAADDKVVLIFGLRRGGGTNEPTAGAQGAYYAVDVTDPANPVGLWRVGPNNDKAAEMGETWSQPRIAKLPIDDNNFRVVAFVGGGYDNNEDTRYGNTQEFVCESAATADFCADINLAPSGGTIDGSGSPLTSPGALTPDKLPKPKGRGIFAIEVAQMKRGGPTEAYVPDFGKSGEVVWSYTNSTNSDLAYSFPTDLTVLDYDGNGYSDRIYAADTGGNLWRFDLSDASSSNWHGNIIFKSNPGADGSKGRKIFYRPVVASVGAPHIFFGTGDREHPLNLAVTDRMYCVIDWGQTTSDAIDESKLEDVTTNLLQDPNPDSAEVEAIKDLTKRLYSTPSAPYDGTNFRYGWYIQLDGKDRNPSTGELGEKVLAPATVFNGQVFFSTYQLNTGDMPECKAGNLGTSRLYHLYYRTGEAVENYDVTNDLNGTDKPTNERASGGDNGELLGRTDRVRTLGEGIPSGIVTLIDASGKVTLLISSSDKVEASGLPDVKLITPVYWMQW